MTESLTMRSVGDVAVLTLNRPSVRNALSAALRKELVETVEAINRDDRVLALVLTGTDPAFCSGVDFNELGTGRVGPLDGPVLSSNIPLIGAINGPAYTGGLELALACHFLVASDRATFADTHARLGLMPGWGLTVLLAEAVGIRRAREMSTTSMMIDAATAYQWGLVNHVVAHERLLETALGLARSVSANDSFAVQTVTRLYDNQRHVRDRASWELETQAWIEPPTKTQ